MACARHTEARASPTYRQIEGCHVVPRAPSGCLYDENIDSNIFLVCTNITTHIQCKLYCLFNTDFLTPGYRCRTGITVARGCSLAMVFPNESNLSAGIHRMNSTANAANHMDGSDGRRVFPASTPTEWPTASVRPTDDGGQFVVVSWG